MSEMWVLRTDGFSILSFSMQLKRQKSPVIDFHRQELLFTRGHKTGSLRLSEKVRGQKIYVPAWGLTTAPALNKGMGKHQAHCSSPASEYLQKWWRRSWCSWIDKNVVALWASSFDHVLHPCRLKDNLLSMSWGRVEVRHNWQELSQELEKGNLWSLGLLV